MNHSGFCLSLSLSILVSLPFPSLFHLSLHSSLPPALPSYWAHNYHLKGKGVSECDRIQLNSCKSNNDELIALGWNGGPQLHSWECWSWAPREDSVSEPSTAQPGNAFLPAYARAWGHTAHISGQSQHGDYLACLADKEMEVHRASLIPV